MNRQTMENSMADSKTATGRGKYVQRRKHVRLGCLIPFRFSLMEESRPEGSFSEEEYNGFIRDLSGGGIKMAAEFEMAEEDLIKFTLQLDKELLELIGGIRHKTYASDPCFPYLYGIMFMKLSVDKREKIILHLHRSQLESLGHLSRVPKNYQYTERAYLYTPNLNIPMPVQYKGIWTTPTPPAAP